MARKSQLLLLLVLLRAAAPTEITWTPNDEPLPELSAEQRAQVLARFADIVTEHAQNGGDPPTLEQKKELVNELARRALYGDAAPGSPAWRRPEAR